ncbi:methyl-accepting chemotaxis protein, partial [Pelomonas sp. HMWF004]
MTTRQRLSLAFGALALLVLLSSVLGLHAISSSDRNFARYVEGPVGHMDLANDLMDATNARAIAARNLIIDADPGRVAMEKQKVEAAHAAVQTHLAALQARARDAADPQMQSLVDAIAAVEAKYGPVALDIVGKTLKGDREAATARMNEECKPLLAALLKATKAYLTYGTQQGKVQVTQADQAFAQAQRLLLAALAVAILAAGAMAWLI